MILFIEPICRNMSMYVPAYSLPLLEIASFVKKEMPGAEIAIVSMPVDYGLPLTPEGKESVYASLLQDLAQMKPRGVGISCTAIVQAEEVIELCERIKRAHPEIFVFLGGYFPTIYYEEIFEKTDAVDLIVVGEGEIPALKITECLERGGTPTDEGIPGCAWKRDGKVHYIPLKDHFDLKRKAAFDLQLLRYPQSYEILPYAFSRGCPYKCNFCMEEFIRPLRREVPHDTVHKDLRNLLKGGSSQTLLVCDALFKSFDLFPEFKSLGMKVNFETRCDLLDPTLIPQMQDVFGMIAFGFESASYNTLKRMNKVRDRSHYDHYVSNMSALFKQAVKSEIPVMIFVICGYPGDTEEDLRSTLSFVQELAKERGAGGYIFNVGECRVYLKTKTHALALSLPDVVFDNDGILGENIVRQPSLNLQFDTVLRYIKEIYSQSHVTPKLRQTILNMMPFNRLPPHALRDEMIPLTCFKDEGRTIFNGRKESLHAFRGLVPDLFRKYEQWTSGQRSKRNITYRS